MLTPFFAQQQFDLTTDRRSVRPQQGLACMDCHSNGHTNGGTHLVGDTVPNPFRNRVDTPTLRGVNIQRLFGSQRALKTVEDFTQFEQTGAYFNRNVVDAIKKGMQHLDRIVEVHPMAEMQEILDFPPAPKLDERGRLSAFGGQLLQKRGEALFFGKAQCASCHTPPFYTDNTMHDLEAGAFFQPRMVERVRVKADGPIKTFPLRRGSRIRHPTSTTEDC